MALSRAALGMIVVTCAGMATGLGASAVFFEKLVQLASKPVLAASLAFAAGVMLYVSFIEIFVKAQMAFEAPLGPSDAYLAATASLFAGMALMSGLDKIVHSLDPAHDAAHSSDPGQYLATPDDTTVVADVKGAAGAPKAPDAETGSGEEAKEPPAKAKDAKLQMTGLKMALAIGIHNLPEGLATFVGTIAEPAVGISLGIAIAIHNIPEGLCVAMPVYFATGDRWRGFKWALLSGVSEPIGAALGWVILRFYFSEIAYGIVFGAVAGMMVMICMHELIPTAHRYDPQDKYVTKGIAAGMLTMAASLCLFVYG